MAPRRKQNRAIRNGGRILKAKPDPVDVHVGARLRLRRTLLGMSQEKLGEAVNLTFQQIQKYERGTNRMGASRLYQISRVLDVPITFFYEGLPEDAAPVRGMSHPQQEPYEAEDQLSRRETMELIRAYYRIPDPVLRKRTLEVVKAIAGSFATEELQAAD